MAGTTEHFNLPTVSDTDITDGATQITDLAEATDAALYQIDQKVPPAYTLPVASADVLGGVKVGKGLTITADGLLSVDLSALVSTGTTWGDIKATGFLRET